MRIVSKLRLCGDKLSPTNVPEPLFEFLYSPFNFLQYFKDGVLRSIIDNILVSDPDSKKASGYRLTLFPGRAFFAKPNTTAFNNNIVCFCHQTVQKSRNKYSSAEENIHKPSKSVSIPDLEDLRYGTGSRSKRLAQWPVASI